MQAHRTEATIDDRGELHIVGLPFQPGQIVEVIVMTKKTTAGSDDFRPLRGKSVQYSEPDSPVGEDDWEALH